jgi:hypothetical protein
MLLLEILNVQENYEQLLVSKIFVGLVAHVLVQTILMELDFRQPYQVLSFIQPHFDSLG